MNTKQKIKKIIIGLLAGFISGLFSTGGGLILVPAFTYLLKLETVEARATSIMCILPMVLTTSFFYAKNKYIDWRLGFLCAIGGIIGSYIGSKVISKIPTYILKNIICNIFNICGIIYDWNCIKIMKGKAMEILFGIISGFISSIGMRRRNCINLLINCFFPE